MAWGIWPGWPERSMGRKNIERIATGVNHRVGHSVISSFYHPSREFRFLSHVFHAGHSHTTGQDITQMTFL